MTKAAIKDRVLDLQAQIGIIMKAIEERPNFDIDEKNWRKMRTTAKKARTSVYQKSYGRK